MSRLLNVSILIFLLFCQVLSSQTEPLDTIHYMFWSNSHEVGYETFVEDNCIVPEFYIDPAPPYKDAVPGNVFFECAPCFNCFVKITDYAGTFEMTGRFISGHQDGAFIVKKYMGRTNVPSLNIYYFQKGRKLFSLTFSGSSFRVFGLNCETSSCEFQLHMEEVLELFR